MEYVTVGVSDMEESIRLFRDVMMLDVEADYEPSAELLSLWGLAGVEGARVVELSCSGYPVGRLRLLATVPPGAIRVRDDHGGADAATDVGVKAIDFYVRPPIRRWIETLEAAGCRARSEPIRWEIGEVESEEINISGPDGYPMLLMVGWRHPEAFRREWEEAKPFSEVATTSVVCGDLDANRHFYGEVLGLTKFADDEVADEYRELAGHPDRGAIRHAGQADPLRRRRRTEREAPPGALLRGVGRQAGGQDAPRSPRRGDVHPHHRRHRRSASAGCGVRQPCRRRARRCSRVPGSGDDHRRTQRRAVRDHRSDRLTRRELVAGCWLLALIIHASRHTDLHPATSTVYSRICRPSPGG